MKLVNTETGGDGKERLIFAIGKEEIKILISLLNLSILNTPRLIQFESTVHRMRSMKNKLSKTLEITDTNKYL